MSHQPERIEKNCLNCGTEVAGPYCQHCGQHNTNPHQSFWQMVTHFVYDIFHFDGKFFDTVKHLLFNPGYVPREYVDGKRARYLDPTRMYLFMSAFFFLVFFAITKVDNSVQFRSFRLLSKDDRFRLAAATYTAPPTNLPDSLRIKKLNLLLDTTRSLRLQQVEGKEALDTGNLIYENGEAFRLRPVVDTITKDTSGETPNWFIQRANTKWKLYKRQYGDDTTRMALDFLDRFLHWFPYILFVSLPFFAGILKLLYLRRKNTLFSDHAVFTLYHFIFSFIITLLFFACGTLKKTTGYSIFGYLQGAMVPIWAAYLYISMKRFYQQSWRKTFIKFLLLNLIAFVALNVIFALFSLLFILQL